MSKDKAVLAPSSRGWARWCQGWAGLLGASGVALAAVAAHYWSGPAQDWAKTAAQMLLFHAVALLGVAGRIDREGEPFRVLRLTALAWPLGSMLFAGSLVGLAAGWFEHAPTAPVGGMLLILGWLIVLGDAVRSR